MRIYMATNVYRPKIGGVTRSIEAFSRQYRAQGHEVKIIAPSFAGAEAEDDVLRVPAIHEIWDGGYSLPIPYPGMLVEAARNFPPDIVHAHHPFLLGHTGHKLAASLNVPVVYTHHARFDAYGNYFPKKHGFLQNFVVKLSVHFANLCDAVIAPGTFVRNMLSEAGVTKPIHVLPTGPDVDRFAVGDGADVRRKLGIAADAPVVGHVGRLALEKNLDFLTQAMAIALRENAAMHFLVIGDGDRRETMEAEFEQAGVVHRVHLLGMREGQDLIDSYHALDLFAFASKSETQGMVVTEAMAAGVPVVALDAAGVDDVVVDKQNGRLLASECAEAFAAAIHEIAAHSPAARRRMQQQARATAKRMSIHSCARQAIELYEELIAAHPPPLDLQAGYQSNWEAFGRRIQDEVLLLGEMTRAAREALFEMRFD